jgi:hypothetical protein
MKSRFIGARRSGGKENGDGAFLGLRDFVEPALRASYEICETKEGHPGSCRIPGRTTFALVAAPFFLSALEIMKFELPLVIEGARDPHLAPYMCLPENRPAMARIAK